MSPAQVLIVDANIDSAQLLEYLLSASGFEAMIASTARDGLLAAAQRPPRLILLDPQLPDIDGYQVLGLLRARAATRGIPIVAVTAAVMREERERIVRAGFDGCIAKPIEPEYLVSHLTPYLIGDRDAERHR